MDKRTAIVWSFYDFATTPVAFVINAMYLPLMVVSLGGNYTTVGSLSIITAMVAAIWTPIVGAIIDRSKERFRIRRIVIMTSGVLAASSISLMSISGNLIELLLLFVMMSICVQTGWTSINAYLAAEAYKERLGSISGLGILMGYIGGGIGAMTAIIFDQTLGRTAAFGIVAAFLFIFITIPSVYLKNDQQASSSGAGLLTNTLRAATEILKNRSVRSYLVSSVLWGDAISTIMTFASLIAVEVFLVPPDSAILFLGLALPSAALGSVVQGKLGDEFGIKLMQGLNLILWALGFVVIIVWADIVPIIMVSIIAGFALGGNLALSRALYAKVIPKGFEGRLFGFSAIFAFFGGALGPLLTGFAADLPSMNLRTALLVPLAFVLLSLPMLALVQENGAPFEG